MRFCSYLIVFLVSGLSAQQEPGNLVPLPAEMNQEFVESLLEEPHSPDDMIHELRSAPRAGLYRFETEKKEAGYLELKVVRGRFLVQHPLEMEGLKGVVVWPFDEQMKNLRHWNGTLEGKIQENQVSYGENQLFTVSLATVDNGNPVLEMTYRMDGEGSLIRIQGVYREGEEEMAFDLALEREGEPGLEPQKNWIERNLVLFIVSIHLCWIVPTVLFLVFYPIYVRKQEARRTLELAAVTEELGLGFDAEGDPALSDELASFPLFTIGGGRELKNLVSAAEWAYKIS